ncbi:MAG: DUF1573 domain-containing protein [Bacteroidetes bacterium]|nr:DUF1573 domain-containing protein [Bacteroidota bacterium]
MKRFIFTSIILLLFTSFIFAQQKQAAISFETTNHNFGKIKELGGKATFKFGFTNTGSEPLVIEQVRASCGCTSTDWTKQPISAGGKGYVAVSYNPKHRPGKFSKSVTVTTNSERKTMRLRISGEVIPKPRTVEDDFPYLMGKLRLKTNHVAFMRIVNSEIKIKEDSIINTSSELMKVTFKNVPSYLKLEVKPKTLKPKEKGVVKVTYDATVRNDWGFLIDRVEVLVNGVKVSKNRMSISSTVEEDFSKLTEKQLKNAPSMKFEERVFNFGKINQGEKVEHIFKFKNEGKSDLIIHKTRASCGCTAINMNKTTIKKGEESSIKVVFNSRGKRNQQNKTITIISNDPKHASTVLKVSGFVNVPKK